MKHKVSIYTLALLGALALAAVSGGLLTSSDNVVYALAPTFDLDSDTACDGDRCIPENTPPGVNIGDPISATDPDETGDDAIEFGNTLTYKLGGDDAASFDIDPSTGQLITKAPLDTEGKSSYSVTVTVTDSETSANSVEQLVRITITDVNELPAAPLPPTVVSGADDTNTSSVDESTTTLKVVWHPLVNTGRENIYSYTVQYKESTETSFGSAYVDHSDTDMTATITGLEADTSYQVRVRATNGDGEGPWSLVGTGSTNKAGNRSPSFAQTAPHGLNMAENSSPGQSVGAPVTADDADSRSLSYDFKGRDAGLFDFNTTNGQIRTKRGANYNHEDPGCGYDDTVNPTACTYYVTVVAFDGAGGSDALRVAISVTDRTELPSAPARPTVSPTANSRTSLDVSWSEPVNTGPAITGYTVEYRLKGSNNIFSSDGVPTNGTGTSTTISGTDNNNEAWLDPGMSYEVRVRATSNEGTGGWSPFGTGSTNAGNRGPVFRDRNTDTTPVGDDANTARELNENTTSGRPVGRPVVADDGDGDTRTYKLVAETPEDTASKAAVSKFTINESTGQILTKDPLNHEDDGCGYDSTDDTLTSTTATTCTYTVKVEVRDGLDENGNKEKSETTADDTITVEITVNDVDEPPSMPLVVLSSPEVVTELDVMWYTTNTGPPITSHNLRYRQGSDPWSTDNCDTTAVNPGTNSCSNLSPETVAAKIEELTVNTSYSVQMQARNVEGTSAWSSAVSQRTNKNKPDNSVNSAPAFVTPTPDLDVDESHERRPQDVGSRTASDPEGRTPTYSLEGPNRNLFSIDSSGLIKTRSGLNHEDKDCGYDGNRDPTACTYTVLVKVADGEGASIFQEFTIAINDRVETPSVPSAPRVTATTGSGKSLDVSWSEPGNTGPPITDYDIHYRELGGSDDAWIDWPHGTDTDSTKRTTKITGLDPRTTYEVEVQAKNAEDTSVWSSPGRSTTNASNLRPSFDNPASLVTLSVNENTRAGQPVSSPVSATDNDGNRVTYTLAGPGADSFTIVSSSGQIRTRAALDHEERSSYSVTVKVNDGQRKDNSVAAKSVTIEVANVDEIPSVPAAPAVSGIPGSTSSVRVTWAEPANTGPAITDYDVHYGVAGTGGFINWKHLGVDTSTIITGLTAGTRYEVQVRAWNADGFSDYSRSGTGSPNPDVANRNPVFSGGSRTFSVAENTAAGDPIGDPVDATDPDDDPLAYELEGTNAASFELDRGSGQIRTSAALNHEDKSRYSVTVRARDGRGGTSTAGVTINVTDVVEPPGPPLSPRVTAVSSTSLQVSWDAPENAGPSITDYDYRYMSSTDSSWTEITNTTIPATSVTIQGLTPSTSYDVEVRAKNSEGTSDWSSPGIGSTNAPGANNPPVFSEGASATRSLSASSPTGTRIGDPVAATDADTGDTVAYSLEGRDAASFAINETNGQLLTKSGVTLLAGETYTVVVVADDGTDTSRITVSIEATVAPPNNPPVFSEGASATRNVSRSAPAGTSIGLPVTATDSDPGTTLNYTLEGADATSFGINAANGQLLTAAGVTLDRNSYTVTVVASDGIARASITVAIEVTATLPNNPPTFSASSASRSVAENTPAGQNVGISVSATDADSDDTLNYTLGGTNASSFDIVSDTGQIQTKAALDYETKFRYSVTITVSDSELTDNISVTINVVDMHPSCASAIGNGANTGLANDCEALLDSKETLQGTTGSLNWATFTPIAQWDGIYVNGSSKRVTRLTLRKMPQLNGTIPGALGRLNGLEKLSLYANGLTGPIPAELGNLSRLTVMYINNNDLSGPIPAELGNLTNVERLWLHRNNLSGSIPTQLGSLSNLQSLSLYANELTGSIPTQLGGLTNLKVLYLHANKLTGSIPTQLGDLTNLQLLYLWGNGLTGAIPTELGSLTKLRVLSLGRNQLTGGIPTELGNLSNLERLYIYGDKTQSLSLDGGIPTELGNLTKLTTLVLQYTGLTGAIPSQLDNMTDLVWLNLQNNRLNGEIPSSLGSLSNLEVLYLHFNQLSGTIPSELGNLSELTNLWLKSNQLSGDIPASLNNLTNLERVRISRNPLLTGCVPAALTDSGGADSDAEYLNLATCQ